MSPSVADALAKANVLVEALPYIRRFRGQTVVMKYGGHAMDDPSLRAGFCRDVVLLKLVGLNPVVVHGGGPQIAHLLARLQIPSRLVAGQRITDDATMQVVEMVLGGQVNKELVRLVGLAGGRAVGLTGKDGGLALARRVEKLVDPQTGESVDPGRVGEVVKVDPRLIERLVADDFIPIIAPIAVDAAGETLNVNADPFAAKLAAAMNAEKLVLLTDVQGVRGPDGELRSSLTDVEVREFIGSGVISGGMIPKVEFGLNALGEGVRKVHIVDGRVAHAILLEIFTDSGIGTELVRKETP